MWSYNYLRNSSFLNAARGAARVVIKEDSGSLRDETVIKTPENVPKSIHLYTLHSRSVPYFPCPEPTALPAPPIPSGLPTLSPPAPHATAGGVCVLLIPAAFPADPTGPASPLSPRTLLPMDGLRLAHGPEGDKGGKS
jgi:hypothetical protein